MINICTLNKSVFIRIVSTNNKNKISFFKKTNSPFEYSSKIYSKKKMRNQINKQDKDI